MQSQCRCQPNINFFCLCVNINMVVLITTVPGGTALVSIICKSGYFRISVPPIELEWSLYRERGGLLHSAVLID